MNLNFYKRKVTVLKKSSKLRNTGKPRHAYFNNKTAKKTRLYRLNSSSFKNRRMLILLI